MEYCYVENGQIVEGPMPLPENWRNISGLSLLSQEELLERGWIPVEATPMPAIAETQKIGAIQHNIAGSKVVREWVVVEKPSEELLLERKAAARIELDDLDRKSVRPMRAFLHAWRTNDTATMDTEAAVLAQRESRAKALRDILKG